MLHRSVLFTLVLLTLTTTVSWGETADHAWSLSFGGSSHDSPTAVATDGFGNIYVTGSFQGTIDLGGFILTSAGGSDIFLAKYAPNGFVLWAKRFGDGYGDSAKAIACDDLGFVVITGIFFDTLNLGGATLYSPGPSVGQDDMYVAKFSPNGTHIWSKQWAGVDSDVPTSITFDDGGNVFFTGYFLDTLVMGGGVMSTAGAKDIFLAKLDPDGVELWGSQFGGTLNDDGTGIAMDNAGNVVLAANGQSPMDFGGGTLTPISSDIFLAKFNTDGTYLWANNYGGSGSAIDGRIGIDSANSVVVAGTIYSNVDMGGGVLPTSGVVDAVVAKYDENGAHIWSYNYGGPGWDFSFDVAVDDSDGITITGRMEGTANFGGADLIGVGAPDVPDIFVAHYDSSGAHQWSKSYGGSDLDGGESLATDAFGNVILLGGFRSTMSVGTNVLTSAGGTDGALIKYYQGPTIDSVQDIPGDQGGMVNVSWYANGGDNGFDQDIGYYSVWRAIDTGTAMAMVEKGAALIDDPAKMKSVAEGQDIVRASGDYFWYQMATVSAIGLTGYSAPVATLFDSTGTTPQGHYFQVIAHSYEQYRYYTSSPVTGHSVDNLAPAAPQGLIAAQQASPDGLVLTWNSNSEEDLSRYQVYRGTDPGFTADGGSFLSETSDTTALDTGWSWDGGYWYKVFAVDVHDNKSPHALIGPDLVSGAGGNTPAANRLDQNVPNPFNPTTSIEFSLVEAADVTLRIYNASGQLVRTLVDGHRAANAHTVSWDGRDSRGQTVASGVYFYRLNAGAFVQTRKMVLLK